MKGMLIQKTRISDYEEDPMRYENEVTIQIQVNSKTYTIVEQIKFMKDCTKSTPQNVPQA